MKNQQAMLNANTMIAASTKTLSRQYALITLYSISSVLCTNLLLQQNAYADNNNMLSAASQFNPSISLILDGNYVHDNKKGKANDYLEEMAGISHTVHDAHAHELGLEQGFNLGESELVMSAIVDPYFDGKLTLAIDEQGTTELEEAWLQTRLLPAGLKIKMGKFLSDLGYLNSQHAHTWDFTNQNLAYTALLGEHGLKDTGIQLTWLAPTPFYTLLGVEALQGKDQERFGALVDDELSHNTLDENNMLGTLREHKAGPRMNTLFAKFAPDLGSNHALQWGFSYAQAHQYQQLLNEDEVAQNGDELALDGKQTLMATDIVYKWDSAGEQGQGDVKLIAEYLKLKKDMTVVASGVGMDTDGDTVLDTFPLAIGSHVTGSQDGYTLQASYGIAPRWQLAIRHDATGNINKLNEAGNQISLKKSSRNSLAVSFYASEFSRLRLQASQADLADEMGKVEKVNQIFLQYTHSLGPHGAHKF